MEKIEIKKNNNKSNNMKDLVKENKELKHLLKDSNKRNKSLEKKLEIEKVKAIAFSTMIDIAEETLKVPIRKK